MVYTRKCRTLTKVKKIEWVYLFVFINKIALRYQILSDFDANSVNFRSLGEAGSYQWHIRGLFEGDFYTRKLICWPFQALVLSWAYLSFDEQFYSVFRLFISSSFHPQQEPESLERACLEKGYFEKRKLRKTLIKI